MTTHLPDVNVLVALIDPSHMHHERAHAWFAQTAAEGWLSCPITQNGVIRVVSHSRYSNAQPVATVLRSLDTLVASTGHTFVPDSVSLLDDDADRKGLLSSAQVTDAYLLRLAITHHARLATFDRGIIPPAHHSDAIEQIP